MPDQVRLWFYAYDCYLWNRKLSEYIRLGEAPETLPFLTSFDRLDWEPYRAYLEEDQVNLPSKAYRDFPFIRIASRRAKTLQKAEIHGVVAKSNLAVFAFSLPKGSYATSLLMHFFTLSAGLPALPGIPFESVDAKEIAGLGTLTPTLERFKKVLESREADITGVEE